ncbi:putative regulator of nonsense transcripts [Plasmodium gaboni]|uniref:Putative regulator of nonsense transcripts n=1 Tax=Plasmodium gaboni TaxID=647221 RepID=A0A151LKJ1_9APIC|nr:putative regulator of nonsense transcripts [Plasmodium gaboni]KYN99432.1 putative regulator of nonsense transcripts [Plasmodium gaboni]
MDKTFDYNNINVDNFDELYDFCISKDTNKKKIKEGNNFLGDQKQIFNDDKDRCNKEVVKKYTNIKDTKKHGNNKKSEYSPCSTVEEKRLDMLNDNIEDTDSYYDRKKKNSHKWKEMSNNINSNSSNSNSSSNNNNNNNNSYDNIDPHDNDDIHHINHNKEHEEQYNGNKTTMKKNSESLSDISSYNDIKSYNNVEDGIYDEYDVKNKMKYDKKKNKHNHNNNNNNNNNNNKCDNNKNYHNNKNNKYYNNHLDHKHNDLYEEGDTYKFKNKKSKDDLKYYRCRYCDIDSIDSVVQCNNCKRWFCNGSYGTCGSHIVTHLVRSKHKEIKLHKNSLLGETILECYNCACRNVFLLGFLPTSEEGVVVIICRDPCLSNYIALYEKHLIDMDQNKNISLEDDKEKEVLIKDEDCMHYKEINNNNNTNCENIHCSNNDEKELVEQNSLSSVHHQSDSSDYYYYYYSRRQKNKKLEKSHMNVCNDDNQNVHYDNKLIDDDHMMWGEHNKRQKNIEKNIEKNKEKNKEKKYNEHIENDNNIYINNSNICEEIEKIKDWDLKKWQPVIEDRFFLEWLVNIPSNEEAERKGKLSTSYNVNKLEELWKNKKDVYIDELNLEILNDEPNSVELKYEDAYHYQSIFSPLIQLEADYDKSIKEGQKQGNVTVRWDIGLNKKRYAHFIYVKEESELRLVAGDELKISYTYPDGSIWCCEGHISRLHNTEEIALELRTSCTSNGPWVDNITTGFTVEFIWKSTAYDRMQLALNEFALNSYSLSGFLYHKLLGHDISEDSLEYNKNTFYKMMHKKVMNIRNYSAPNLAPLNHSQIDAIKKSLLSPLSLIQGPPGTGKTLTCATLVYHLVKMNMGKVLVTAPSNVAVDQLSVRIHRSGLKVVRLCAKSRESVPSIAEYLYLHNQMKLLKSDIAEELNKLLELKEEVGELSQKDERRLKKLISFAENEILIEADVICCTCVGAMDKRLKKFRFRQVLVDEATQSTEPECLVPLVTGAKQIVLVGDHCQLGPIIVCKKAANAGLGKSLFERLVMLGITPFRLEVQYRMHPALSEFPSYVFYDGSLQNGITLKEREYPLKSFPWPNPKCPMFFYNSTGLEEMSASGTSYLNRSEASNMEKLVRTLLQCGLKASQIGVITPYEGQRAYITSLFQKNISFQNSADIEVASVDAFQGREKDFILLSCVRSNKKLGIGFLNDPRRLNVALTRAKYGLIICGNAKVLSRHHFISREKINSNETITNVNSVWINLLSQFKKKDLIVEGCLSNLKPVNINIPTPTKLPSRYTNFNYFHSYDNFQKNRTHNYPDKLGSNSYKDKSTTITNQYKNNKYNKNNKNNDELFNSSSVNDYYYHHHFNTNHLSDENTNSQFNLNLSNYSYCSENIMNNDLYTYITKNKKKNIVNSYVNNLSQMSQFNDYATERNHNNNDNPDYLDIHDKYNNSIDDDKKSTTKYNISSSLNNSEFSYSNNNKMSSNHSIDSYNQDTNFISISKNADNLFPYLFYYKSNQNDSSQQPYMYYNENHENINSSKTQKGVKNTVLNKSSTSNMTLTQKDSVILNDHKLSCNSKKELSENTHIN